MYTRTRSKHMNQAEAKIRIDELKAVLWENSRKYYVENAPTMSDYDYDQLMHELERLEAAYPEFATPDSPTRRVGSDLETPEATLEEGVRRNDQAAREAWDELEKSVVAHAADEIKISIKGQTVEMTLIKKLA